MDFSYDEIKKAMEELGNKSGSEPQRILMSGSEWSMFSAACKKVGVEPTGNHYLAWRLRESPFDAEA